MMLATRYVIATSLARENALFAKQLKPLGLPTLSLPSIALKKNLSKSAFMKYIADIDSYDWILFTSSNGVLFFIDGLKKNKKHISLLHKIHLAAVGDKTAETMKQYGLEVSFIPSAFTTQHLLQELGSVAGKKILLPRSAIGNPQLTTLLEEKGATVVDMPIYTTVFPKFGIVQLKKLLVTKQILYLTFTSPSTVEGFLTNIPTSFKKAVLSVPVISIGPVTSAAAKQNGFQTVFTADIHTKKGMITKIKESIL